MPELPEVEGVVRELQPIVEGKTIARIDVSDVVRASHAAGKQSIIKNSTVDAFETALVGMTITTIERRAKYIFFHLKKDKQYVLVNHLGMTGAWFIVRTLDDIIEVKFRKHVHVVITFTDDLLLVYADIRRFGECRLLEKISDYKPLLQMAPEPFDSDALAFFLDKSITKTYANKPIKAVIMDGRVVSGCGNIYATEALFRTAIHPQRITCELSDKQKKQLFLEIVQVLTESITRGGSSISDYRNTNGEAGGMQHYLQMYGKKTCGVCDTAIEQVIIAGRNSSYCPTCQQ